jgi:hypothetical protein
MDLRCNCKHLHDDLHTALLRSLLRCCGGMCVQYDLSQLLRDLRLHFVGVSWHVPRDSVRNEQWSVKLREMEMSLRCVCIVSCGSYDQTEDAWLFNRLITSQVEVD